MLARRAALLFLAAMLTIAGCGGPSETERVSATVKLFADATAQHDYTTLCQKVLAPELIAKLKPFNLSCEIAVRHYFGEVRNPRIDIRGIRLVGRAEAIAAVQSSAAGEAPSVAQLGLVKTGVGWRIARLANAPAAPRPCLRPAPGRPCVGPAPPAGAPNPSTPND